MKTIRELLAGKGRAVWSVDPDASVYEAIAMMADKGVGALLVMDGERIAGVISERDYARKVILEGRSSKDTRVGAVMTGRVVSARPDQSVEEGLTLMTEKRVRHLPVLEGDALVGIVSIGDLVKAIIEEQRELIGELERYISG